MNNKRILLVPKSIVAYKSAYTPERFHQHFVLNFLQGEHIRLRTNLVQYRRAKRGQSQGQPFVTKKDLKEKVAPFSKDFLSDFTQKHRLVFDKFKKSAVSPHDHTIDRKSTGLSISDIAKMLKANLRKIPSGNQYASDYHSAIIGILEFVFHPSLNCPKKEREIHDGRKRIDIVFDNCAKTGFFHDLHDIHKVPCSFIMVECKNYTNDPKNPELDQIAGRFGVNRGQFGLVLCRTIDDLNLFLKRCADTRKDGRGVILPLVDSDLISILDGVETGGSNKIDDLLRDRYRTVSMA